MCGACVCVSRREKHNKANKQDKEKNDTESGNTESYKAPFILHLPLIHSQIFLLFILR